MPKHYSFPSLKQPLEPSPRLLLEQDTAWEANAIF